MIDGSDLSQKINKKVAKIGVIGLGYVGLPLALLFAKKGFTVTGFARDEKKAALFMEGKHHLLTSEVDNDLRDLLEKKKFNVTHINSKDLKDQDVLIICVPTPIDENKKPDLRDLLGVADSLSPIDLTGKLIVNESTVAPFTTRKVFGRFKSKHFLVSSPERIDPGNDTKTTATIPKVIGGINKQSAKLARVLYGNIMKAEIIEVGSLEAAEMAKMLENTYRAVNIALIDEFAKVSEACGIDILEVIKAAKTKWSFQVHYPGLGVGGHCIPVDPYYIVSLANDLGVDMPVVTSGLSEIAGMPLFVFGKVLRLYKKGMKVLVYGLTYKKDVGDLRESPVIVFCKLLKNKGIEFSVYDPFINPSSVEKMGFVAGNLEKTDVFVVGTDHSALMQDYHKAVDDETIIIDGRNFFTTKKGKGVYGVGRTII